MSLTIWQRPCTARISYFFLLRKALSIWFSKIMMYSKRTYLKTTSFKKNNNPISPSVLFHWLDNLVQFFDYFTIAGTKNVLIHMTLHLNFAQYLLLFIKKIRLPPSTHINMFINLKDLRKYSYKEHCHTVQLSQLRDQIL